MIEITELIHTFEGEMKKRKMALKEEAKRVEEMPFALSS